MKANTNLFQKENLSSYSTKNQYKQTQHKDHSTQQVENQNKKLFGKETAQKPISCLIINAIRN